METRNRESVCISRENGKDRFPRSCETRPRYKKRQTRHETEHRDPTNPNGDKSKGRLWKKKKIFCGWKINQLIYGKKMENFCSSPIERYNPKTESQKSPETDLPIRYHSRVIQCFETENWTYYMTYYWHLIQSRSPMYNRSSKVMGRCGLQGIKQEGCHLQESSCDAGENVAVVCGWAVFLPMGCIRHSRGERGTPKRQRKFLRPYFPLTCLRTLIDI